MKRTKNYFDKPQPHHANREALSGCIRFDGEDLGKPSPQLTHQFNRLWSQKSSLQIASSLMAQTANG